jgi:Zn finger protein HypA/HybF involved in hydrogenase expression
MLVTLATLPIAVKAQQDGANVMVNGCITQKVITYPAECQNCGAEFIYFRTAPAESHRVNYCPNCGRKNTGLAEDSDGT